MSKIAITGPHGADKATLGLMLSQRLGHPLITSTSRETAIEMGYASPGEIPDEFRPLFQWKGIIMQLQREYAHASFVSDRSAIDFLAYWKVFLDMGYDPREGSYEYHAIAQMACKEYDVLIYLPPNRDEAENGGVRFTEKAEETNDTILNLIGLFGMENRFISLAGIDGPSARFAHVITELGKRKLL